MTHAMRPLHNAPDGKQGHTYCGIDASNDTSVGVIPVTRVVEGKVTNLCPECKAEIK